MYNPLVMKSIFTLKNEIPVQDLIVQQCPEARILFFLPVERCPDSKRRLSFPDFQKAAVGHRDFQLGP